MIVNHRNGSYQIHFEGFQTPKESHVVVSDTNVASVFQNRGFDTSEWITLTPGEASKNLGELAKVWSQLAARRVNRKTKIVAVGGGVVGDLVGYAAASFLRGVPFIQVPTTLLAQVDSSVGGKVAIDLPEGKNLVGAFYPPSEVWIDPTILTTLPEREFRSGMAEVIKYGWILDGALLAKLNNTDLTTAHPELAQVIERCVDLKREVVEADEFETLGRRAKLNFGHTVGHAIEQVTQYEVFTHGEAISIGMVAEAIIAEKLGRAQSGLAKSVESSLSRVGLPTRLPSSLKGSLSEESLVHAMRLDKKADNAGIHMALVFQPGESGLVHSVSESLIKEVLTQLWNEFEHYSP